jgi:hypothetical protein
MLSLLNKSNNSKNRWTLNPIYLHHKPPTSRLYVKGWNLRFLEKKQQMLARAQARQTISKINPLHFPGYSVCESCKELFMDTT